MLDIEPLLLLNSLTNSHPIHCIFLEVIEDPAELVLSLAQQELSYVIHCVR